MMREALIAKEAACRKALEEASDDWQTFKRELGTKFDSVREEALWEALTEARLAHDAAYDALERL